jgi:hypothetical protein
MFEVTAARASRGLAFAAVEGVKLNAWCLDGVWLVVVVVAWGVVSKSLLVPFHASDINARPIRWRRG